MDVSGPDVFIEGEKIFLRALSERDLEGNWYRWFNDPQVTYYQDKGFFPNTPEKQRAYFEHSQKSTTDVVLGVVEKAGGAHIGNVGLHEIHWIHRHAVFGIVIGETSCWGKGYGSEAWWLMTRYGFRVLNLHRIKATVMAGHRASLRAAEKAGFRVEGEMKDERFKHGAYHDVIMLGVTQPDWVRQFPNDEKG